MDKPSSQSPESLPGPHQTVGSDHASLLREDDLGALRPFGERKEWPAGAMLFRQGDRPEQLFVIEQGEVELIDESAHERRIIQIVPAGSSVGDLPVLLETPCLYTAVTRGATTTLGFSRETVRTLLEANPQICFLWLRILSRRLEHGYRRFVKLPGRPALQRLSHYLVDEVDTRGATSLDLTQRELASTLGLGRQTVSRELGKLELLGLVKRGRGQVRIIDPDGLRALLPR